MFSPSPNIPWDLLYTCGSHHTYGRVDEPIVYGPSGRVYIYALNEEDYSESCILSNVPSMDEKV